MVQEGRWILLFLIIVAVIFVSSGRFGGGGGIKVGSPSSSGTVEEELASRPLPEPEPLPPLDEKFAPPSKEDSSFKNKVTLSVGNASSEDANSEYIELSTSYSNQERANISGMTVENDKKERFQIRGGSSLPYAGQVNAQESIMLDPGARVYIVTGRSPIDTSFRTNVCTGYFVQFHEFEPRLREDCPRPEDESSAKNLQNDCVDVLETLQTCRQPLELPFEMTNECRNYANTEINYAKCVDSHRNNSDFYQNEWYVYLGRPNEIWKERRDTITLRDRDGKIVDSYSY